MASHDMNELGGRKLIKNLGHHIVRHKTNCCRQGIGDRRRWCFDAHLPPHRGGPSGSRIKNVAEASGRVEGRANRF